MRGFADERGVLIVNPTVFGKEGRANAGGVGGRAEAHRAARGAPVGIAAPALSYRLQELDMLSDWHCRRACIELGKLGSAIGAVRHASAELLERVFTETKAKGIMLHDVARDSPWPSKAEANPAKPHNGTCGAPGS
jgi:hypothetical protein